MIEVACPTCGKEINAPEEYAGRKAKCFQCGSLMMLPDLEQIARSAVASRPPPLSPIAAPSTLTVSAVPQAPPAPVPGSYPHLESVLRSKMWLVDLYLGSLLVPSLLLIIGMGWQNFTLGAIAALFGVPIILALIYVQRVLLLAGFDVLQVLINIERNTRPGEEA